MNIDTNSTAPTADLADREAAASEHAIKAEAKQENTRQIAELSDGANEVQQAEHIRGMVAVTMANLSINASGATRENAGQWQEWALGAADGVERGAPAVARRCSLSGPALGRF